MNNYRKIYMHTHRDKVYILWLFHSLFSSFVCCNVPIVYLQLIVNSVVLGFGFTSCWFLFMFFSCKQWDLLFKLFYFNVLRWVADQITWVRLLTRVQCFDTGFVLCKIFKTYYKDFIVIAINHMMESDYNRQHGMCFLAYRY